MQAPGMRAVEMAKANGQWDKAYGGGAASIDVPAELQAALATNLLAQQLWNQLDARNRFAACFRVMSPKREATRLRKADEMVAMLIRGARIYP